MYWVMALAAAIKDFVILVLARRPVIGVNISPKSSFRKFSSLQYVFNLLHCHSSAEQSQIKEKGEEQELLGVM